MPEITINEIVSNISTTVLNILVLFATVYIPSVFDRANTQ